VYRRCTSLAKSLSVGSMSGSMLQGERVLHYAWDAGWNVMKARNAGARVAAFELSERSLEIARRNATREGVSVDFRVLDAVDEGLEPQSFRVSVCACVLHDTNLDRAQSVMLRFRVLQRPANETATVLTGPQRGQTNCLGGVSQAGPAATVS
jgi:2-polyprenyl-3-methyl-5-hydroxy-6-metoxy-1,4-benzoquinol methylase